MFYNNTFSVANLKKIKQILILHFWVEYLAHFSISKGHNFSLKQATNVE